MGIFASHQSQHTIGHVVLRAEQDVIFVQAALDAKSLADASHRHNQNQKCHLCCCVHGVELRRSSGSKRRSRLTSKLHQLCQ